MERGRLCSGEVGGICYCLQAILVLVLAGTAIASTATFISDGVLGSQISGVAGRSLLQAKKSCPVAFQYMNYTIITSQCKRPDYSPKLCCGAFLEFACPYSEQLNDLTNDCATIMFSYINLNGNYPPGLFANECRGSKEGLDCPADGPSANALGSSANPDENAATVAPAIPAFGVLVMLFLLHVLLF